MQVGVDDGPHAHAVGRRVAVADVIEVRDDVGDHPLMDAEHVGETRTVTQLRLRRDVNRGLHEVALSSIEEGRQTGEGFRVHAERHGASIGARGITPPMQRDAAQAATVPTTELWKKPGITGIDVQMLRWSQI